MSRSMDMSGRGRSYSVLLSQRVRPDTGCSGRPRILDGGARIRITLAAALWVLSGSPAHAYLVYETPTVGFSDTASVTDTQGGATSTSNDNASLGSSELEQFNASLGVLTGVTLNLESTLTPSLTVASTAQGGSTGTVTSNGTGSGTAAITAPGASYTVSGDMSVSGSCSGQRKDACSHTTTGTVVDANQNLAVSSSLDSYVGTGTVTVERTAPTLGASQVNNAFSGTDTTQYDLKWTGNLSASYTYLLHAAPSFDGTSPVDSLTLDFGTVSQNSDAGQLGFSIFNLADPNRTALDLLGWSGATGALDSGLSLFSDLTAGSDMLFYATLDTTNAGVFSATYVLTLSDAAGIGTASSHNIYTLTLTLTGRVAAVPVPDSVWLFGSGLIGVVGVARRKGR